MEKFWAYEIPYNTPQEQSELVDFCKAKAKFSRVQDSLFALPETKFYPKMLSAYKGILSIFKHLTISFM